MFRSRLFVQVVMAGLVTSFCVVAAEAEAGGRKRSRCCKSVPTCCKPVCCVAPAPVYCPPNSAPSIAPVHYESGEQSLLQSPPLYEELPPGVHGHGTSTPNEGGGGGAIDGAGQSPPPPKAIDPIPGEARRQRPQRSSRQLVTSSQPADSVAAGTAVRTWRDITGEHETTGRLLWVRNDIARIAKTTGTTTTVSLKNLSKQDRQYIDRFVASSN